MPASSKITKGLAANKKTALKKAVLELQIITADSLNQVIARALVASPEVAKKLVLQTGVGSTEFARQSGTELGDLRRMVTSPGGTTAEALKVFETGDFKGLVDKAVAAAIATPPKKFTTL